MANLVIKNNDYHGHTSISLQTPSDVGDTAKINKKQTGVLEILTDPKKPNAYVYLQSNSVVQSQENPDLTHPGRALVIGPLPEDYVNTGSNHTVEINGTMFMSGKSYIQRGLQVGADSKGYAITANGDVKVNNNLNTQGNITSDGSIFAYGPSEIFNDLNVGNNLSVLGQIQTIVGLTSYGDNNLQGLTTLNMLTVENDALFKTDVLIKGDTVLQKELQVDGIVILNNELKGVSANFSSTLDVSGKTTLKNAVDINGTITAKNIMQISNYVESIHTTALASKMHLIMGQNKTRYFGIQTRKRTNKNEAGTVIGTYPGLDIYDYTGNKSVVIFKNTAETIQDGKMDEIVGSNAYLGGAQWTDNIIKKGATVQEPGYVLYQAIHDGNLYENAGRQYSAYIPSGSDYIQISFDELKAATCSLSFNVRISNYDRYQNYKIRAYMKNGAWNQTPNVIVEDALGTVLSENAYYAVSDGIPCIYFKIPNNTNIGITLSNFNNSGDQKVVFTKDTILIKGISTLPSNTAITMASISYPKNMDIKGNLNVTGNIITKSQIQIENSIRSVHTTLGNKMHLIMGQGDTQYYGIQTRNHSQGVRFDIYDYISNKSSAIFKSSKEVVEDGTEEWNVNSNLYIGGTQWGGASNIITKNGSLNTTKGYVLYQAIHDGNLHENAGRQYSAHLYADSTNKYAIIEFDNFTSSLSNNTAFSFTLRTTSNNNYEDFVIYGYINSSGSWSSAPKAISLESSGSTNATVNQIYYGTKTKVIEEETRTIPYIAFSISTGAVGISLSNFAIAGANRVILTKDSLSVSRIAAPPTNYNSANVTYPIFNKGLQINNILKVNGNYKTTLGGALEVTGATTLKGATTISGATQINNTLTVTNNTTLNGVTQINNTLTVGNYLTTFNGTTQIKGKTTISNQLGVTGATTLSSTLDVTGKSTLKDTEVTTFKATGATTISSTLSVASATTLNGKIIVGRDNYGTSAPTSSATDGTVYFQIVS